MSYIGNSPGVASQRVETAFTATASQTVFTPSSGYTLGYCDVYYNGVKLVNGDDYTAADGVSITLATAAAAGDSVVVVASFPRGLTDGYLKAEADAKYVALTGDQTIAGVKTFSGSATIVNGNLGVGTSSVLGNSTFNATLGIAVRNQSTSMGYFQTYNANAGSNLKTWRFGGDASGNLVFETVNDAYSSATNRVTLGPSGFVGIGQTNPTYSLDILANTGNLLVHQTRAMVIDQERNLGGIRGGGYSTGTTIVDAAEIGFASSGAWSSTSTPSYISFATTASGSTTLTERARIDPSGQVGFGVAPSNARLMIKGDWVGGHATVKALPTTSFASGGLAGYGIFDSDGSTRKFYFAATSSDCQIWGEQNTPMVFGVNNSERARIDTSGAFTVTNQPASQRFTNPDQSVSSGTYTAIQFGTNSFTQNITYTANGRFTAVVAGKYLLTAWYRYQSGSGFSAELAIKVNGSYYTYEYVNSYSQYQQIMCSVIVNMAVGDYIDIQAYQNSGGSLNITGNAQSSGVHIHKLC